MAGVFTFRMIREGIMLHINTMTMDQAKCADLYKHLGQARKAILDHCESNDIRAIILTDYMTDLAKRMQNGELECFAK